MILVVRTDKPQAEIGIYSEAFEKIAFHTWIAHRELSKTLLSQAEALLKNSNADFKDLRGLIFFAGPGSFTGLRIGASFVNALAASLSIPAVAVSGEDWVHSGITRLNSGQAEMAVPHYGSEAHTTTQKK